MPFGLVWGGSSELVVYDLIDGAPLATSTIWRLATSPHDNIPSLFAQLPRRLLAPPAPPSECARVFPSNAAPGAKMEYAYITDKMSTVQPHSLQRACAVAILAHGIDNPIALERITSAVSCASCGRTDYTRPLIARINTRQRDLSTHETRNIVCDKCDVECARTHISGYASACCAPVGVSGMWTTGYKRYHTECYQSIYGGIPLFATTNSLYVLLVTTPVGDGFTRRVSCHVRNYDVEPGICLIDAAYTNTRTIYLKRWFLPISSRAQSVNSEDIEPSPLSADTIWRIATTPHNSARDIFDLIPPLPADTLRGL